MYSLHQTNGMIFEVYLLKKNKIERIYFVGHYKEIFLTNLVDDQKCIKRQEINEFLSSYVIKGCKVF